MEKDFTNWHKVKTGLQKNSSQASFEERDVWWCSVGLNVGDEEDGKGANFRRPVLVLRKFNKRIFWGVPLTTQVKDKPYYHKINFKGAPQCAMITQLKLYDSKRLSERMGKITHEQLKKIKGDIISSLN